MSVGFLEETFNYDIFFDQNYENNKWLCENGDGDCKAYKNCNMSHSAMRIIYPIMV